MEFYFFWSSVEISKGDLVCTDLWKEACMKCTWKADAPVGRDSETEVE